MSDAIGPPPERFELTLQIEPGDIDVLGHVNNVVYLRWVQDAAVAHWRHRATPAMQAAVLWVAVRHEIDYQHPAMPGDIVIARTWVGPAGRRSFERHTEILRDGDYKLLARARTIWCPIDPATQRPMDVGADVRAAFSTGPPQA